MNHQKESYENFYKDKIEEALKYTDDDLSGVYGYDEQFLKVNGEDRARLSLIDLNTHVQLNRLIVKEFNIKKVS